MIVSSSSAAAARIADLAMSVAAEFLGGHGADRQRDVQVSAEP
ncbi:hypothetical protein Pd630_LPD13097 (plasmid) [Rhodococcus opacus PD630]|nr:hypothetical protein Pd630_LPD13097 [Rhodococcus opacus PD630]